MVSATQIFESLASNGTVYAERHEVVSGLFSNLRRSLRNMARIYHDADDLEANEALSYVQRNISEWLTVPVAFDEAFFERLKLLGMPELIGRRWGAEMAYQYRAALDAAQRLTGMVNPLAALVGERIRLLQVNHIDFRVFCHRAAVPAFNDVIAASGGYSLSSAEFLHSWRDYRECAPFEILIKIGPLRAHGWGAVPDAISTAPRFKRLLQFVWSGCNDEPEFGYDPVTSSAISTARLSRDEVSSSASQLFPLSWKKIVHRSEQATDVMLEPLPDEDEFQMFREFREINARENRQAILIQINEEHGILIPPLARVLCFEPRRPDEQCIGYRIAGDSLTEGSFMIRSTLQGEGGETLKAQHGRFSQIWKSRLRKRLQEDPVHLIRELNAAGLDLTRLDSALHHWTKPPTTVIHAPQQKRHFEILVRVLEANFAPVAPAHFRGKPLWIFAWQEICNSRGEAIHAGVINHAQEEERLVEVLLALVSDIRNRAVGGSSFTLPLPDSCAIAGIAFFDRVVAIEDGFRGPDQKFRVVQELSEVEQWRV